MNVKNTEVIDKCIEVLRETEDGNTLTERQLSEVQFLTNNYYRLSEAGAQKAVISLENMKGGTK